MGKASTRRIQVKMIAPLLMVCLLLGSNQAPAQITDGSNYGPTRRLSFDFTLRNPRAAQGIMVGEVTSTSALVQVRLTRTRGLVKGDVPGTSGVVEFTLQPAGEPDAPPWAQLAYAFAERDFIARVRFDNLDPGTQYVCQTRTGIGNSHLRTGPTASFRTLPGPEEATRVHFVVVTGMNYAKFHGDNRIDRKIHLAHNNTELPEPYAGPDKKLGYPALESILRLKPDFFVGTGDNVYYDTPKEPRAETIPQMRQKWHEQFVQQRYRDLFAAVPTYWEVDDHDYRIDDGDNTGDHRPSPAEAQRVMLEQLPYAQFPYVAANEPKPLTYRTHRMSKDLQVWFMEGRIYRSPNLSEDGPDKSIWGVEQKAWLKRTLKESNATFKVMISATPMVGPDDIRKTDNHTNHGGFRHEGDEFFAFVKDEKISNLYLVCGDRHWQYHAMHPSGIEEFSTGALVDANSRPGRKAGDPLSTDPDGLIKQFYLQDPPSGGFLHVISNPATLASPASLTFEHRDEKGVVLNRHTKQ
jgi:alkaline phosphatase/alkaline phosphatase D